MRLITTLAFLFASISTSIAQDSLRVLFLGNSYTNANNLPGIVQSLADAEGHYVYTESNTPGGHTIDQHSTNSTSLSQIMQGNWDYVVLQEQSQIPTIDYLRYNLMYPGAESLEETIREYNPCANIVMYMTWGRQNGGMQCTSDGVYCSEDFIDFSHMTDTLASAYEEISEIINAKVAPVGKAWDQAISYSTTDPTLVLHSGDQSHPNYSGSYLAACVFHGVFWNQSPVGISFTGSLNESQASYLQESALITLEEYHEMNTANTSEMYGAYGSEFSLSCELQTSGNSLVFNPTSEFSYSWLDGQGQTIEGQSSNTYTATETGSYSVEVTNTNGCSSSCSGYIEVSNTNEIKEKSWVWKNPNTLSCFNCGEYQYEIFNYEGRLLHSANSTLNEITICNLTSGIYFIRIVEANDNLSLIKFVR